MIPHILEASAEFVGSLMPFWPTAVSRPVEKSSFRRLKIPHPWPSGGLQFRPVPGKWNPAGEAEVGSGGDQPAKE
jgi:hypothetical protein